MSGGIGIKENPVSNIWLFYGYNSDMEILMS